jgi:hypothetical protein
MKTNFAPVKEVGLDHPAVVSNHAAPSALSALAGSFVPNTPGHAGRCDRWGHPCSGCKAEISRGEPNTMFAEETER